MSLYARGSSFPSGELYFSVKGVDFLPDGGINTCGYKIDDEDNIIGHYLNGRQVSWRTFEKKMAKDKSLSGRSLNDREASFWFLGNPSPK
ncbi:MAG: hypothetical protein LBE98_01345 [Puniceicoccales bacterium]|jgi:hypothetical protein|nr:hypothetical protein [Puniceicoccales bacterium]